MFPNSVPMGSDTPSPEPLVYFSFIQSFMYNCRSPQKGVLLHAYGEKHKVTVHGAPRRLATPIRVYPPQLLPPPTCPRVEQSTNLWYPEVWMKGWIYGRPGSAKWDQLGNGKVMEDGRK